MGIILHIILFLIWFIFIKKVKKHNKISNNCIGYNCISIGCNSDSCKSGYCIGEKCQAGNCVGTNCSAGDCFGSRCIPGKCIDPKCVKGTCPQNNKQCRDGRRLEIKRPSYYKYTKKLPYGTILNPPLCDNSISVGELRRGLGRNLGIKSINITTKGTIPYKNIFTDLTIKDMEIINFTIPNYKKDYNCNLCINENCENHKPNDKIL